MNLRFFQSRSILDVMSNHFATICKQTSWLDEKYRLHTQVIVNKIIIIKSGSILIFCARTKQLLFFIYVFQFFQFNSIRLIDWLFIRLYNMNGIYKNCNCATNEQYWELVGCMCVYMRGVFVDMCGKIRVCGVVD